MENLAEQLQALQEQIQALQAQLHDRPDAPIRELATAVAQGFKIKQPDTYDGRKGHVELWLFQVQQYFNAIDLRDDERMVYYATNLLRGDAATWWRMRYTTLMATRPPTPLPNWHEFQEQLIVQFKPVNAEKIARDKLAKLCQSSSV